ncbi:MAG: FkbM family methyltransferase, partial [Kangiellaceae bacterium]|nr:FkbM family methyltransferase [Kangiellaceae bacterium]
KPNYDFIARFPKAERFDIVKKVKVSANQLDSLDLGHCDFLKLDIQGGELAALQGGSKMLKGAFGLEVEVEFLKIYQDQPLFGEICEHLAEHGFEFVDFTTLTRWGRKKRTDPGKGQCTFGNALFLKPPEMIKAMLDQEKINISDIRRYLAILALYRRADLLDVCIDIFTDPAIYDEDLLNDLHYVNRITNSTIRKMKWLTNASNFLLKMIGSNMRFQIQF